MLGKTISYIGYFGILTAIALLVYNLFPYGQLICFIAALAAAGIAAFYQHNAKEGLQKEFFYAILSFASFLFAIAAGF